jgi:hypothetical protein
MNLCSLIPCIISVYAFRSCVNHVLLFLYRYAIVYLAQMKPLINPILSGE